MNRSSSAWYAIPAIAMLFTLAQRAHGYIDSGTGSYLLQVMLAGLLGASFMAKNFWNMVRSKLSRRPSPRDDS